MRPAPAHRGGLKPVTPMLDGLGAKLAEKWLSTVAAPGLFFVGAAVSTVALGHGPPSRLACPGCAGEALGDGGVRVVHGRSAHRCRVGRPRAVAVGTLVRACAAGAERIWTGNWPAPARPLALRLTAHRTTRWRRINGSAAGPLGTSAAGDRRAHGPPGPDHPGRAQPPHAHRRPVRSPGRSPAPPVRH